MDISEIDAHSCQKLRSPNGLTVALATFICVGILVSYLPQHIKIIQRRSSEGLSPWWVLLGAVSSIAAFGTILVLPSSREDMMCCKVLSGGECAAAVLGIAQIGGQWTCFMFIVFLYVIYFPVEADLSSSTASITQTPPPKRRDAVVVGGVTLLSIMVVLVTSLVVIFGVKKGAQPWANILGTTSSVLSGIQYVPQIWYTYQLGDIKSLSIETMIIQVPGAFLFALSLWLRVGWEGWSTWLVYCVTGILQGVLLALAITYWLADRRRKQEESSIATSEAEDEDHNGDGLDGQADQPVETTALLSNGSGTSKGRPVNKKDQRNSSQRTLDMLYKASPRSHDSSD